MARKTAARKTTSRREAGAGARMRAEVRDHIIGVALGLFGLLSVVALLSSGGSVLEWWRSVIAVILFIPTTMVSRGSVRKPRPICRC